MDFKGDSSIASANINHQPYPVTSASPTAYSLWEENDHPDPGNPSMIRFSFPLAKERRYRFSSYLAAQNITESGIRI